MKCSAGETWFDEQALILQHHRDCQQPTPAAVSPTKFLFHCHGKKQEVLYADVRTWQIFRVDADTEVLTEEELAQHWEAFEKSDFSELKQFVDENALFKMHISDVSSEMVIVDCTWVRKFKRNPDRSMKAKSRLCARGFLDPQKSSMPTRSTTATRLSQRIVVSLAAALGLDIESLDVSGAFLKGLSFEQVRQKLQQRGITSPHRMVAIIPPANVWRHLAKMDSRFAISEEQMKDYLLGCHKPIYGLNDAPLAWQLCLHDFIAECGATQSTFDENLWYWKNKGQISCILTTHVDDIAIASSPKVLDGLHESFSKKFGKVTREKTPFQHCGMVYEKVPQGFLVQQYEFTDNLKMAKIENAEDDERSLTREEVTQYRSVLGGLLWLTATRIDLIADVCRLQTFVTQAKVKHLKMANDIVKRAQDKKYKNFGIIYRRLPKQYGWRLACIHDASSASQGRTYANEGILILLTCDKLDVESNIHNLNGLQFNPDHFGGEAHILWAQGNKAKRISYSTSHGETLAAINGMESASLVALILGELLVADSKPTLAQLAALQERGVPFLPVDAYTDCRDFYELSTGVKAMPQDKSQRIYIMAHREARLTGRIRWVILIPTSCMTSDALTKVMVSPCLNELLTSGIVKFFNVPGHEIEARRLPVLEEVTEDDLHRGDLSTLEQMSSSASRPPAALMTLACFMMMIAKASAADGRAEEGDQDGVLHYMMIFISLATIAAWYVLSTLMKMFLAWYRTFCLLPVPDTVCQADKECQADFVCPVRDQELRDLKQQSAHLQNENALLKRELEDLRRNLKWSRDEVKETENTMMRLRQRLRNYEDPTSSSSSTEIAERKLAAHEARCPLGKEAYFAPSGEVWHTRKNCDRLKCAQAIFTRRACKICGV